MVRLSVSSRASSPAISVVPSPHSSVIIMVRTNEQRGGGGDYNGTNGNGEVRPVLTPKPLMPASTIPVGMPPMFSSKSMTSKEAATYVGFANIPNQVFRRAIKQGFDFTLMVVGQSGLGKSTFINTLFSAEINETAMTETAAGRKIPATQRIDVRTVRLLENGVGMNLTLVDTPGFGDFVDNSKCWSPIVEFIEHRYLDYFSEETKIDRAERIPDRRVHLCLYFIAPTGHGLKPLDIEFMRQLHERVNVVSVVAKADTMTKEELNRFKKQILSDMKSAGIKEYSFPEPEDMDERSKQEPWRERVPFAVVGSNLMRDGPPGSAGRIRYREYAWGTVEIENTAHNDFMALREMIVRRNLIDLIDVTRSVHYENFRCRQLNQLHKSLNKGTAHPSIDRDPLTQLEQERTVKQRELNEKLKNMEKVTERNSKLVERQNKLESKDREQQRIMESRRTQMETLQNEVRDMRQRAGLSTNESRSSVNSSNGHSPPEKKDKKKMMSGLFGNRNKSDE